MRPYHFHSTPSTTDTELEKLRELTKNGSAQDWINLHRALKKRPLNKQSREEEIQAIQRAAELKHPNALQKLSHYYEIGLNGIPQNQDYARKLILLAANLLIEIKLNAPKPSRIFNDLKHFYLDKSNPDLSFVTAAQNSISKAYDIMRTQALEGNPNARLEFINFMELSAPYPIEKHIILSFSRRYADTLNIPDALLIHAMRMQELENMSTSSIRESIHYYTLAHTAGAPNSAGYLGELLADPKTDWYNEREACLWFKIDADNGCIGCALELALRLETGKGTPRDLTHAAILLVHVIKHTNIRNDYNRAVNALLRINTYGHKHPEIAPEIAEILEANRKTKIP